MTVGQASSPLDGSIEDLGRLYRSGATTPNEVVAESLDRAEGVGADLGAVSDLIVDALDEAGRLTAALAAGQDRGPLHGVPVVVKELIDVAGHARRAGTHVRPTGWEQEVAEDAAVVAALRRAGAVIVARGRTHEFAWGITSRHPDGSGVANPLDPSLIAGGSSGGVAALVAAGVAPVGVGTDTGGSVRIPAAFCGLVGWKPQLGRLSTLGVVPLAPAFDTVGLLTRSVADVLVVDRVLGGGLAGPASDVVGSRVEARPAVLDDPSLPVVAAQIATAVGLALDRAGIAEAVMPGDRGDVPSVADVLNLYAVLQRADALAVHRDLLGTWPDQADAYGEDVAGRMREAEQLDPAAVAQARLERTDVQARFERLGARGVDALVSPTTACFPSAVATPDDGSVDGSALPLRDAVLPFTVPANVTGWPALTIPLPVGTDTAAAGAVPPSIQLVARPGREHLLPALAARLAPP